MNLLNSRLRFAAATALIVLSAASQALVYDYSGTITTCSSVCDASAALGGPGGAANPTPSVITGTLSVDATAGGSFTDADIAAFAFAIFSPAEPVVAPIVDDAGTVTNPNLINPVAFDESLATASGGGDIDASGNLSGGTLLLTFTGSGLAAVNASVLIDLAAGSATGFLFDGSVLFFQAEGGFTPRPIPLPAGIWLLASALTGFGLARKNTAR